MSEKKKEQICVVCERWESQHIDDGDQFPCLEPGLELEPLLDCIIVRMSRILSKDKKDLVLPDTSIEGKRFTVVAVGVGCKSGIAVGDRVILSGTEGVSFDWIPGFKNLLAAKESALRIAIRYKTPSKESMP